MTLFKLLVKFEPLSEPNFLAKGELIVTSLTTEPALTLIPEPWPPQFTSRTILKADLADYQAAFNAAANGNKPDIDVRNKCRLKFMADLKAVAPYLESVARTANDESILDVTGFDRRHPIVKAQVNGTFPAPAPLKLKHGSLPGVILGRTRRLDGALSYQSQQTADDPRLEPSWKDVASTTGCGHLEFPGLTPGQVYHFRLRGLARSGFGPWSDFASLMAM